MTHKGVCIGAKHGGERTLQIYGRDHYKEIGRLGGESVKKRKWFHELARKNKKGDKKC